MEKNASSQIIKGIVLAKPGTDITQMAREYISEREKESQIALRIFNENQNLRKIISEEEIEKMKAEMLEYWSDSLFQNYNNKTITYDLTDLTMIPPLVRNGYGGLAKKIVNFWKNIDISWDNPSPRFKFDKKQHLLLNGLTSYPYGGRLSGEYVSLDANLALAYAFASLEESESAKIIKSLREKLIDISPIKTSVGFLRTNYKGPNKKKINEEIRRHIKLFKDNGFNVKIRDRGYSNFGKDKSVLFLSLLAEHQEKLRNFFVSHSVPYREDNRSIGNESSNYLTAETLIGEKNLVKKIIKNLGVENEGFIAEHYQKAPCDFYFGRDSVENACKYLLVFNLLNEQNSFILSESDKILERCFVKDLGLYKNSIWSSQKIDEMDARDQLYVAFLSLSKGDNNQAKQLLTTSLNAGLYNGKTFLDKNIGEEVNKFTNSLGISVLEGLLNPFTDKYCLGLI